MEEARMDGYLFAYMIRQGAKNLEQYAHQVDALNVFPVPDGDTGTNMSLSFSAGVAEMNKVSSAHVGDVAKALSKGLLMGARGNSGVILSQLFRGFAKSVAAKEKLSIRDFSAALQQGVETAYQAVMKPVEGTILTVAKDAARKAEELSQHQGVDFVELMEVVVTEAENSLQRTPDLLPILKQVGVVDSGGQGLLHVYQGFLKALKGEEITTTKPETKLNHIDERETHLHGEVSALIAQGVLSEDEIEYGYCTEFIIRLNQDESPAFNEVQFKSQLSTYGDSILVIADDELVKVHIHSEQIGQVLSLAQSYGELVNIKIENMREQFRKLKDREEHPSAVGSEHFRLSPENTISSHIEYGIVAVVMGDGLADIFKSLGVTHVIAGGQTMNPSTQSFVDAMEQLPAERIILLPNNSNVILTAEQAARLVKKQVAVIPSKNVMQGLASLIAFDPALSLEENREAMVEAIQHIATGQVTYAVRDTVIDGLAIKQGQYMGILDERIRAIGETPREALLLLLDEMVKEESELVTLIYGEEVREEEISQVEAVLAKRYTGLEVEVHAGGQPLYPYLVSVE